MIKLIPRSRSCYQPILSIPTSSSFRYRDRTNYSNFANINKWAKIKSDHITIPDLSGSVKCTKPYLKKVVCDELTIKLAQQIVLLESFPYGLCKMPSIEKLRHQDTPIEVCGGIHEWKLDMKKKYDIDDFSNFTNNIDTSINSFYKKRLSSRIIISNYVNVEQYNKSIVSDNINISDIINVASLDATHVCNMKYGDAPNIVIIDSCKTKFSYIESHLHYIIFELLKNSAEAVMKKQLDDPPDIKIFISKDNEKPIVKIHDKWVGISPKDINKVWSYLYSTSDENVHDTDSLDLNISPRLSGFGYGIPMSRLTVEYFNGMIRINSVKDLCTDVHLYL
jgi:hypothetical protein